MEKGSILKGFGNTQEDCIFDFGWSFEAWWKMLCGGNWSLMEHAMNWNLAMGRYEDWWNLITNKIQAWWILATDEVEGSNVRRNWTGDGVFVPSGCWIWSCPVITYLHCIVFEDEQIPEKFLLEPATWIEMSCSSGERGFVSGEGFRQPIFGIARSSSSLQMSFFRNCSSFLLLLSSASAKSSTLSIKVSRNQLMFSIFVPKS